MKHYISVQVFQAKKVNTYHQNQKLYCQENRKRYSRASKCCQMSIKNHQRHFIFIYCRCSVFVLKGTEYEKLGIGQLHIKTDESDGKKKILLVRAATTTGKIIDCVGILC